MYRHHIGKLINYKHNSCCAHSIYGLCIWKEWEGGPKKWPKSSQDFHSEIKKTIPETYEKLPWIRKSIGLVSSIAIRSISSFRYSLQNCGVDISAFKFRSCTLSIYLFPNIYIYLLIHLFIHPLQPSHRPCFPLYIY